MSVEWDQATTGLAESGALDQLHLPCVVKVDGETGGAWLLYDGPYGPGFAWLPNTEGVGRNLQALGVQRRDITQTFFDEMTDDTKWAHWVIYRNKPS